MNELQQLFAHTNDGYICISVRPVGSLQFKTDTYFAVNDLEKAALRMRELARDGDCYYSFNVLGAPPSSGRGRADDFVAVGGVFLDIDLRQSDGNAHAANDQLPSNIDDVYDLLVLKGLPLPTQVICSGNGYYFQYLFDEPVTFGSTEERAEFQNLSSGFHKQFQKAFTDNGWKLDNVSDLPRITRLSGTFNHKTSPAKHVTFEGFYPERRMTLDAFRIFALVSQKEHGRGDVVSFRSSAELNGSQAETNSKKANFRAIIEGCRWAQSIGARMKKLPYQEWFNLAGTLKHCEGGEALFHELSEMDLRYDVGEAQATFDSVQGPMTCNHISNTAQDAICQNCPAFRNKHVGSPNNFGHEAPMFAGALGQHVFVVKRELFFDLQQRKELTKTNFNDMYLKYFKSPSQAMLSSTLLLQAQKAAYLPGISDLFVTTPEGELWLNVWRPGELTPLLGDMTIILEHFEYLIPVKLEREHVFNILAHAVQFPGIKIKHCLMFIGGQGTGKSWLFNLCEHLFGAWNVIAVDNESLTSQFNARLSEKQVAVLEEVGQEDRADAYNRMKTWITQEFVTVEEKHQPRYDASTPRLMIAFSNRDLPIKIEADDRRFMFVDSVKVPKNSAYYETLFCEGLGQAAAFLQFLLDRDLTGFSPNARPPMTKIKERIAASSKPAAEAEIEGMIRGAETPFDRPYFRLSDLANELRNRLSFKANMSNIELARVLGNCGYGLVDAGQVRVGRDTYRLWAHHTSVWATVSPEELRAAIMKDPLI